MALKGAFVELVSTSPNLGPGNPTLSLADKWGQGAPGKWSLCLSHLVTHLLKAHIFVNLSCARKYIIILPVYQPSVSLIGRPNTESRRVEGSFSLR